MVKLMESQIINLSEKLRGLANFCYGYITQSKKRKQRRFKKVVKWRLKTPSGERVTYKDLFFMLFIGMIPIINIFVIIGVWIVGREKYYIEVK